MTSPPEATPRPGVSAAAKRPAWVWVITIFYVFSIGFALLSIMLILSRAIPTTPAAQAYFAGLGPFDYMMTVGLGLLTLTAAVHLFLLKRAAAPLFAAAFVLSVGFTLLHAVATNWAQAGGGSGLVGTFIGWAIQGAVVLYSRHLRQAGVLR